MYMIKITGVLAVMIGVVGLLDSWKKTMDQRLSFLADFCRLYKSGRFYLAQQKMKTPVFFDGFKGENEYFTKICRKTRKLKFPFPARPTHGSVCTERQCLKKTWPQKKCASRTRS